ncbi:MAG: hypothetical protein HKL80_00205 [Acidimicrobiales bacterium]|nr:hypothetical protein [Acidimicrobiales bacterium]
MDENANIPEPTAKSSEDPDKVLADADSLLASTLREDEASEPHLSIEGRELDTGWRRFIAHSDAELQKEYSDSAEGVAEVEARDLEEDKEAIEADVEKIEKDLPNSPLAAEAESIKTRVENDSTDANREIPEIAKEAGKTDEDERKLRFGQRIFGGKAPTWKRQQGIDSPEAHADTDITENTLGKISHDLADADSAKAKLEADMKKAGESVTPESK